MKVQSLACSQINLLQNKAGKSQVISRNYIKRLLTSPVPMTQTSLIHCPVVLSWETNSGETRPSDAPLACSREGSPNTNSGGNPAFRCALWLLLLRPADHSLESFQLPRRELSLYCQHIVPLVYIIRTMVICINVYKVITTDLVNVD